MNSPTKTKSTRQPTTNLRHPNSTNQPSNLNHKETNNQPNHTQQTQPSKQPPHPSKNRRKTQTQNQPPNQTKQANTNPRHATQLAPLRFPDVPTRPAGTRGPRRRNSVKLSAAEASGASSSTTRSARKMYRTSRGEGKSKAPRLLGPPVERLVYSYPLKLQATWGSSHLLQT